jgi:hypothetical protein
VVEIKPGEVHRLVISFGSLFPPVEDARYKETPHLRKLVRWLYLSLDGRVVFSRPFEFYACDPGAVLLGASVPGGTACAPTFTGRILEARRLPPGEIFAPAGMPPEP